jgi:hypothetical protein
MTRAQRILDLIDTGLQTPQPDPSFGEVSPTEEHTCLRCPRSPEPESDFCAPCRAFLLGDLVDDPAMAATTRVAATYADLLALRSRDHRLDSVWSRGGGR